MNESRILSFFRGWPIVGRLSEVPPEALREARDEFVSALGWSTLPFWLAPLIGAALFLQPIDALRALRNGEFFIYSATILGPLSYLIHKRYGRYKARVREDDDDGEPLSFPFPYGRSLAYMISITCILSGVIFSIQQIEYLEAFKNVRFINRSGLIWLSVLVFVMANIVVFCVLAYRNMLDRLSQNRSIEISGALKRDEDTMIEEWERHRS